jgi:site-specific DNA-methyltransferase (adenine-specific)
MNLLPTFASQGQLEPLLNRIHHCDALDLLRRLPDASVDMVLIDPPYDITAAFWEMSIDFAALGKEVFRVIKPSGAVVSTAAQPFTSKLVMAWEKYFRYEWIWRKSRKTNFLNAKRMPLAAHESILVFGHKLPDYYPQMETSKLHQKGISGGLSALYGDFTSNSGEWHEFYYPNTVLEFAHDPELTVTKAQNPEKLEMHPTQKPLALWEYLMTTYTTEGALVVDCFAGSGTTAIAARNLNRRFICGDLHEPYVTMARIRLANSDPFKNTTFKDGTVQLSLFASA